MNTDASVVNGIAAGGGIIRNHKGDILLAFDEEFGNQEILTAEALALLHGFILCEQNRIQYLAIEVDSALLVLLILVLLIKSEPVAGWPLCNALRLIHSKIKIFTVMLNHIYREGNVEADCLASLKLGQDHVRALHNYHQLSEQNYT